jgi:hypothetical protein
VIVIQFGTLSANFLQILLEKLSVIFLKTWLILIGCTTILEQPSVGTTS